MESSALRPSTSTATFFKIFCLHDPILLTLSFGVFPTLRNLRGRMEKSEWAKVSCWPLSYISIFEVLTCWRSGDARFNVNVWGAFGASDIDLVCLTRFWSSSSCVKLLLPSTKSLLPRRFSRWSKEFESDLLAFMNIVLPPKYWLRNSDRFSKVSCTWRCWRIWQCASINAIKNLFLSRSEKSLTLSEPKNFCVIISWSSSLRSSMNRIIVL